MALEARVEPARLRMSRHDKIQLVGLALCAAGYLYHYLLYTVGERNWFIEDAGISFAYARNFVHGDGLVPYVGGEPVEGFSNPLWTLLVAAFYAIGVEGWISAKILGGVFGVLTLPAVWILACRALGERTTAQWTALIGPALLAASPQFVVWNTSGLENSLFCFLLAVGMLRLSDEARSKERWPVSAVVFLLLSMTRPEGVMYAAVAWVATMYGAVLRGWRGRIALWTVLFVVPFAAYEAARLAYFAWPLPNTYYAKLGVGDRFQPYNWTGRGWRYLKKYLNEYRVSWSLPVLVFALAGFARGRRRILTCALVVILVALVLWNGDLAANYLAVKTWIVGVWSGAKGLPPRLDLGAPMRALRTNWNEARVLLLLACGVGLGFLSLVGAGGFERGVLWAMCASSAFYPLYVGGDWMKCFRWLNPVTVTLFPLLGLGLGRVLDEGGWLGLRLPLPRTRLSGPRVLALVALVGIGFLGWVEGDKSREFWLKPETTVRNIQKRVEYMKGVQRNLEIDHVTLLDVDMGAHMLYTDWEIVDIAGLIDLPMAHHPDYDDDFIDEYIFRERRPEFAHVHGGWASTSRINRHDAFKDDYLEIPGYPAGGRSLHIGNHIRKDLLVQPKPPQNVEGDTTALHFAGGIELLSWEAPSPVVADGGQVYVRTSWAAQRKDDFRILLFLDDGGGHRAETMFVPGHGYYPPSEWGAQEAILGHLRIQVPKGLPNGEYQVGLVVLDGPTGLVLPVEVPDPSEHSAESLYLPGELILPLTVKIVGLDDARKEAEDDVARAIQLAGKGEDCDGAWRAWKEGTWHVTRSLGWQAEQRPTVDAAMARCWVAKAQGALSQEDRIADLVRARGYDPRSEEVRQDAVPLAEALNANGLALEAEGDAERAYAAYAQALQLDPTRAWTRRHAEAVRDIRLRAEKDARKAKEPAKGAHPTPANAIPPMDAPGAEDAPEGEP